MYYKGTIAKVAPRPTPDAPEEAQEAYDPWEAIQVEWDASRGHAAGECENVCPWEIERDPEDEEQIEQDRIAQEAKAAALLPPPLPPPVLFQEAPPMPMLQSVIPLPRIALSELSCECCHICPPPLFQCCMWQSQRDLLNTSVSLAEVL